MNVLAFILQKEFRQIFRDRSILAMMFVLPTIQLTILPLAANYEVKNINVAYVDHDHSNYSRQLVNKLAASGYFTLVGNPLSYKDGLDLIEREKADLVLEIPVGFERNLVREGKQDVNIALDAINGTKSSLGGAYLSTVLADFNKNLDINYKAAATENPSTVASLEISSINRYNPHAKYTYYMVPGILVFLLTMIGGFITALNIVKEKEIGTIEQINVTPIKKWEFVLGKLIPFWVVGIVVFTVGLCIMYFVYGLAPKGSILLLYLFAGTYMVALLGLGLLISTLADTQLQAMFIAYFFMMVFVLMSGLFTSTDSMPHWAKTISEFTPVSHFIKVVRLIVLKGSSFSDIKTEFGYLCLFGLALNGLAIWNYRKTS